MAEFPALPFYTDAYLADTRHLTTEEHGAYLLLLMCAWRTRGCALKDDDRFLARTAGVSPRKWQRLRPVLEDFFECADGLWRQKKLQGVYRNVEERMAKNRANGAKGGRARATRKVDAVRPVKTTGANAVATGGATAIATAKATKSQTQKPDPEPKPKADAALTDVEEGETVLFEDAVRVMQAANLDDSTPDTAPILEWLAAGADMDADILPVIRRIRARQEARCGQVPVSLAYYRHAILDARDRRLKARARGRAHALENPAAAPKRLFDPASGADWCDFLGDSGNRFRGDWLSANWHIGPDHPVFLPARLGPDPRSRFNPVIPADVHAVYGRSWRWVRPPGEDKCLHEELSEKIRMKDSE